MAESSPLFQVASEWVKPLLVEAFKSIVRTIAVGVAATPLLAGACAWIAATGSFWRGVIAALVALVCCGVAMVFLAGHRAAWRALAVGLTKLAVGEKTLGVVFERLLKVDEAGTPGERGVAVARRAEQVPLGEAERRLSEAVRGRVQAGEGERGVRAWLRRSVQRKLLEGVEYVTLARFREEGAKAGGVDLVKVREELSGRIDGLLLGRVQSAINKATAIATLGATAAALAVAFLLRWVGQHGGAAH